MLLISYYLHSTRTERTASATFQNSIPFIKMRSLKMSTSTGSGTVKSRFKKDPNLEIHLHKTFLLPPGFRLSTQLFLKSNMIPFKKEKNGVS